MAEIKYQEDEDSEVVCCSCKHNVRCPVKGNLAQIECYCAKDNHYINYLHCMTDYCDEWERSERKINDT